MGFAGFHLDARLRTRFDPSDVVQETQTESTRRMDDFEQRRTMPFRLWLRKHAYERSLRVRRDHVERAKRSVLRKTAHAERSSLLLARPPLRGAVSPSEELGARAGRDGRAGGGRIAYRMGLEPAATRKRYGRAMIRLQRLLSEYGLLE